MNDYLYKKIEILSNTEIEFNTKNFHTQALSDLPDGAVTIREAN